LCGRSAGLGRQAIGDITGPSLETFHSFAKCLVLCLQRADLVVGHGSSLALRDERVMRLR